MLNEVIIQGRLTAIPELKITPKGIPVTSFSIATEKGYGDKKKTDFISVVAWRNTAEWICRNFEKGDLISIIGSLTTYSFTDKNGSKHNRTQVEVVRAEFVPGNKPKVTSETSDNASSDAPEFNELPDELPF